MTSDCQLGGAVFLQNLGAENFAAKTEICITLPTKPTREKRLRAFKNNRIAWLIPCYNESLTIAQVIHDINYYCPGSSIYVFDNNSSDDTSEIAKELGAVVVRETRQGKGFVVTRMFELIDADIYIMVDGDATYDISGWAVLAEGVLANEADMVVASRLSSYTSTSFRRFHVFGNFLIRSAINFLFRVQLSDVLSGYRAMSRAFTKNISLSAKRFEIEAELTIKALENGYVVREVPLDYKNRPEGSFSKLNTFRDGVIILFTIIRLFKDEKPLTVFGSAALLLLSCGLLSRFSAHPGNLPVALVLLAGLSFSIGIVMNSISQRTKELMQVLRKHSGLHKPVKHPAKLTSRASAPDGVFYKKSTPLSGTGLLDSPMFDH